MPRPPRTKIEYRLRRIKGRRAWYVEWTPLNERGAIRESTGCAERADAEEWLEAWIAAREAPRSSTVGEILDGYLDAKEGTTATHGRQKSFAKPLKAHFGKRAPEDITPRILAEYGKKRSKYPTAHRNEIALLITALNHAGVKPGCRIEKPPSRPPRDRYLSREQARAMLEAADQAHIKLYLMVAMASGHRRGAILELTWDRVDLDRRRIDFRDPEKAESKKRRGVVPISGPVVAALQTAKDLALSDHVIEYRGKKVQNIKRAFTRVAVQAGVPWASPHILKHSVISWLAEDGINVDRIADMTATDPKTVWRIYRKFSPDYLTDIADSLSNIVSGYTVAGNPSTAGNKKENKATN